MSEIARFPLRVPAKKALGVLKALSNESRIRIMRLLAERPLGVSEIARQIGVSQPTATVYIQQLEEAGLISYRQVKTPQGVQKLSYTLYDSVEIDWGGEEEATVVEEFDVNVPVGHYTMIECSGRSLMANKARVIASTEDVSRFYHPIRMEAELLVLEEGRVRYLFPYNVPADHEAQSLRLSMEVSVAFPGPGRASRLDLRINGKELGLVTIDSAPSLAPAAPMPEWLPRELASSGRLLQVEIGRTETLLKERVSDSAVDIVALYGALDAQVQDRAIAPAQHDGVRRRGQHGLAQRGAVVGRHAPGSMTPFSVTMTSIGMSCGCGWMVVRRRLSKPMPMARGRGAIAARVRS